MALDVAKKRRAVHIFYGMLMTCLTFSQAHSTVISGPSGGGQCRSIVEDSLTKTKLSKPTRFTIPTDSMRHITDGDFKWERSQQPYLDSNGKAHLSTVAAPMLKSGMHTSHGFDKFVEMRKANQTPLNVNYGLGQPSVLPSSNYFSQSVVREVHFPSAMKIETDNGVLIFTLPRQALTFEISNKRNAAIFHSEVFGSLGFALNGYFLKFGFPESFTSDQISDAIFQTLNDSRSRWRQTAGGGWRVDGEINGPKGPIAMMVVVDPKGQVKTASPLVDFEAEDRKVSQQNSRSLFEESLVIIKTIDWTNQTNTGEVANKEGIESDWKKAMTALLSGVQGRLAMIAANINEKSIKKEWVFRKAYDVRRMMKILKQFEGLSPGEKIKWSQMRNLVSEFELAISGTLPRRNRQFLVDYAILHSARIDSAVGYRYSGEKTDNE